MNTDMNERTPRDRIGKVYHGLRITDYVRGRGYRTECVECGKQKWAKIGQLLEDEVPCNHRIVQNYADPKWVGVRVGNLTAIRQEGKLYRFRCDCGTEIVRRPTDVFRENGASGMTCGRIDCPYHKEVLRRAKDKRTRGHAFEYECARTMQEQGYDVEMTPDSGDYGVDFFAVVGGERVAFQCKALKVDACVSSVQEVYSGGRYYDCEKFVVVSPSGFTHPAELMASKLGVQLECDLLNFKLKSREARDIPTNKITSYNKASVIWEIDGVSKPAQQWCDEYGISRAGVVSRVRRGMDLKTALMSEKYRSKRVIEIDGVVKSKKQWCEEFGISCQLYDYRVNSGMTPKEALTTPKKNSCRA